MDGSRPSPAACGCRTSALSDFIMLHVQYSTIGFSQSGRATREKRQYRGCRARLVVAATPTMKVSDPPVAVGHPLYPTLDSVAVPMAPWQLARPNLQRRMTRMNTLKDMGWPLGLTNILSTSLEGFPVRFVVVDNSGSMQSMDGSRLVRDQRGALKSIASTRWAELGDVICPWRGHALPPPQPLPDRAVLRTCRRWHFRRRRCGRSLQRGDDQGCDEDVPRGHDPAH